MQSDLNTMWVQIHFREDSIPSIHAGLLTNESKQVIEKLITTAQTTAYNAGVQDSLGALPKEIEYPNLKEYIVAVKKAESNNKYLSLIHI